MALPFVATKLIDGIQPSIIKDIGSNFSYLRSKGRIGIVLVEQYFDFARELADRWYVMDRGEVTLSSDRASVDENETGRSMSVSQGGVLAYVSIAPV